MPNTPAFDPSGLARAVETLASIIPGYTGYKRKERLREEDRAVRDAAAEKLGWIVGRMERTLSGCIRELPSPHVEEADRAIRALKRHRDRIRFAPAGYTSLFARKQIHEITLEKLLAMDAGLWSVLDELERRAGDWEEARKGKRPEWPSEAWKEAVFALEDALDERESFLRS